MRKPQYTYKGQSLLRVSLLLLARHRRLSSVWGDMSQSHALQMKMSVKHARTCVGPVGEVGEGPVLVA